MTCGNSGVLLFPCWCCGASLEPHTCLATVTSASSWSPTAFHGSYAIFMFPAPANKVCHSPHLTQNLRLSGCLFPQQPSWWVRSGFSLSWFVLRFYYFYFVCRSAIPFTARRGSRIPWDWSFRPLLACPVSSGNRTWSLQKSSQCS